MKVVFIFHYQNLFNLFAARHCHLVVKNSTKHVRTFYCNNWLFSLFSVVFQTSQQWEVYSERSASCSDAESSEISSAFTGLKLFYCIPALTPTCFNCLQ